MFDAAVDNILTCVGSGGVIGRMMRLLVSSYEQNDKSFLRFGLKCGKMDQFNGKLQRYEFR